MDGRHGAVDAERLAEIDQRLCLQEFDLRQRAGAGSSVPIGARDRPARAEGGRSCRSLRSVDVNVRFGGSLALNDVSISAEAGASPGSSGPTAPARPPCST